MKKRGLSTIVATVMIILITIVAASVIAGFAIPFAKKQLQKSTECLDTKDIFYFELAEKLNCNTENGIIVGVGAKKKYEGIDGFDIILKNERETKVLEIREGVQIPNLDMAYSKNTLNNIKIPRSGEVYVYNYSDKTIYSSGEIRTALKNGRVCEESSDKIIFEVC